MKKATVVKLCIVLGICLTFVISYQSDVIRRNKLNNMLNETYDNAIQAGGEMLKKEFPDIIDDDSDFIGYELNGVWHVQNYVRRPAPGISGGKYEEPIFEDINNIRYVKFKDENFDEILAFGSLESDCEEIDSEFTINDFENAHFVLEQIKNYKFDDVRLDAKRDYFKSNYNVSVKTNCDEYINADICQVLDMCYEIDIRNDGMIYYYGMVCG